MLSGFLPAFGVHGPDEFHIATQIVEHAHVFAAHWAVDDRGARLLRDRSGSADLHRAVDDGKGRLEELDIPGRFPDEVWNLEGVANMQNINALRPLRAGNKIHPDRVVNGGSKFKNRLADLAETY